MRLKYEFETMEMDEEIVAVPVGDGAGEFHGVVRLNETAAAIFELLKQETTEEAVVEAILAEYDVEKDALAGYVHDYMEKLAGEGLLAG